jgi:heat shock protein HslJ
MTIRATIGTIIALLLLPAGIHSATAADGRTSDHRVGPTPTVTVPAPEVTTETAEAGSALRGRSFRLLSYDRNSTPLPLFDGVLVQVSFAEDLIEVSTACAVMTSRVDLDDGRLRLRDPLAVPETCTGDDQKRTALVVDGLSADPDWFLDADSLMIVPSRTHQMLFVDTTSLPTPRPLPLYGTRWLVESVIEDGVVVPLDTTPGDGRTPANLVFEEEGRFHGSDGCNQISGDVVVSGDRLEIDTITSTLMLCSWEGLVDRQIVAALMADPRYRVVDGRLHLTSDDGPNLVLRPELTSSE